MNKKTPPEQRFKTKYTINGNGCWLWKTFNGRTYPSFTLDKVRKAHIASYMMFNGNIPKGKVVRHTCHNTGCVNPKHLILGTQKENIKDAIMANRFVSGEASKKSKLTYSQVLEIRSLWGMRRYTQKQLGKNITSVVLPLVK